MTPATPSTSPPTASRGAQRVPALLLSALLAACATPPAAPPPPPPAPVGLADLMERPAERALVEGIRLYDNGQYPAAEAALRRALDAGLASARDQASAHKLIAFITCTSAREADCEAAFRAALAADPGFTLGRAEAGHPMWGPVWARVSTR
ncbi:MAG: TssQ family T6SS-associated lipoprotein [Burkholderiaceae bacterium]|nr:TssQ family T6SS-associated lipoprotein [Rhodoferax sp.]MCP5283342.1 TssQ family T6SS-associated lipoprotein [Burkholderiaceae bacterium]